MTRFRIRELREARGVSQYGLARRLGVTKMAVSRWESGAAMPTADKLPTIAALLECEVSDLYDDETLRAASEAARAAVAAKGAADARAPRSSSGGSAIFSIEGGTVYGSSWKGRSAARIRLSRYERSGGLRRYGAGI